MAAMRRPKERRALTLRCGRGNKEWSDAGDSEAAYVEALRVIHEAEAKIASAAEKH